MDEWSFNPYTEYTAADRKLSGKLMGGIYPVGNLLRGAWEVEEDPGLEQLQTVRRWPLRGRLHVGHQQDCHALHPAEQLLTRQYRAATTLQLVSSGRV